MKLTYENMKAFMEDYFRAYSAYSNSAQTIDRLDEFFAAGFTSVAHVHIEGKRYPFTRIGRDEFKRSLVLGHTPTAERLVPNKIIIDEKLRTAGVLLTIENTIRETGEKHTFDALTFYELTTQEENKVKIERLEIFFDDPDRLNRVYFQGMLALSNQTIGENPPVRG
jgi:hypothetical protein